MKDMQHMSIRLVWHDRAWDGSVCDKPESNVFCKGQFSLQGDYIRSNKDAKWEEKNRGKSCTELWNNEKRIPPCTWTINTFSKIDGAHVHTHPFFDEAKDRNETFPAFTSGTWPMDRMYDVHTRELIKEFKIREKNVKDYFDMFVEGKSLIFYYLNYDNPLNTEKKKYVLVGVSRLMRKGDYLTFDGLSDWQIKTSGNRVWSRAITNGFPDGQGVRIPYQEYLRTGKKGKDLDKILVEIDGEIARRLKYVTRELSDDDACELIQRLIGSIKNVDPKIAPGDWKARLTWLNQVLSETWKERGSYPGLGSVLEVLGKTDGTIFVSQQAKDPALANQDLAKYVFESLNKKNPPIWAKEIKKVWDQYTPTKKKLLARLSSFDVTQNQVQKILSDKRAQDCGITSTIDQIVENPYVICEEYEGQDEDDVIGFYRIDNGLLPDPALGATPEIEPNDNRRVRALILETLAGEKTSSGNCFLDLDEIIDEIQSEQSDSGKTIVLTLEIVMALRSFYEEKLRFEEREIGEDNQKRTYVYLKRIFEDELLIKERVDRLLQRSYPSSGIDWKKKLAREHKNIPEAIYEKVLEQQASAVENCFVRKLSVITGAAGTGKTTVLETLIAEIRARQPGATFLLLAPTGKARENLARRTRIFEDTMTIHHALNVHGWLAPKTYRFVQNKKDKIIARNIIIDESSMLDLELLAHLFRAIQWEDVDRLVLVGDRNQLPPIGFGRPFFDVIDYLLTNKKEAIAQLTINCRQLTMQTNILKLASMYTDSPDEDFETILNNIEQAKPLGSDMEVVFWNDESDLWNKMSERLKRLLQEEAKEVSRSSLVLNDLLDIRLGRTRPPRSELFGIDYFQILSPYRGEFYGTVALNDSMQEDYRKQEIDQYEFFHGFTVGDKVIQIRNTTIYKKESEPLELFNGQLGHSFYIRKSLGLNFSTGDRSADRVAYFNGSDVDQNLELGYAITVHKSQGSEFADVFLVLPKEALGLVSRELVYTALTRSRKKLVLFLQKDIAALVIAKSPSKSNILLRNTSIFKFRFYSEKYRATDLVHKTLKGDYVRSKSEALIANILFENDITYSYEERLPAKDSAELIQWILPDFTIKIEDRGTFYWEHLGMLDNPEYVAAWERKKEWYSRNGFLGNLVWSEEKTGFDSTDIVKIINGKLGLTTK